MGLSRALRGPGRPQNDGFIQFQVVFEAKHAEGRGKIRSRVEADPRHSWVAMKPIEARAKFGRRIITGRIRLSAMESGQGSHTWEKSLTSPARAAIPPRALRRMISAVKNAFWARGIL